MPALFFEPSFVMSTDPAVARLIVVPNRLLNSNRGTFARSLRILNGTA